MKKIALINDLSGFGNCSLTAAIPVISALRLEACPLPTAILTAQTGFPGYYCDDYTDRMDFFTSKWADMGVRFDGICSGYLASPAQIAKVKNFLNEFQKPDTLYLMDPVLGDHGRPHPFCTDAFIKGMRELSELATVITPNLTEACLLADIPYDDLYAHRYEEDYLPRVQDMCITLLERSTKTQTVIVTGILQEDADGLYVTNLAVSREEFACTSTPYTGVSFSGTGDLFASAICGYLVNGTPLQEAMDRTVDFLQPAIEEATNNAIPRDFGIPFQKYLSRLI